MSYNCIWKTYWSEIGNRAYTMSYYTDYMRENVSFFRYIFRNVLAGRTNVNIAIMGGGNGWELTAINQILKDLGANINVSCTIVDNYVWPINEIDSNKGKGIQSIKVIKGDIFDFITDEKIVKEYDLLYFARCINYTDLAECNYLNRYGYDVQSKKLFAELKTILGKITIPIVFAQIELMKVGYTMTVNNNLKNILGLSNGLSVCNMNARTKMYILNNDFAS